MALTQSKPFRYLVAVGSIALLLLMLAYSYQAVREQEGSFAAMLENVVLNVVSIYLLIFLVLLMMRYAILILYSFLDHLESMEKKRNDVPPRFSEELSLPMVSIVVPAYNEGVVIEAALKALLHLDYPNYEVIVIDDGSTDDTYDKAMHFAQYGKFKELAKVAEERARVRRLRGEPALTLDELTPNIPIRVVTKRNGGKAEALNTGMTIAKGEFVLNMDGDTKLSGNTLRVCVAHFADPKVGAVAGNVKVINRENIWTKIQALEYVEGLAMARKAQSFLRSVNIIPGPLGMFRKSVLQQVGGYDHDTFAEDCDLTLKILTLGWHIAYEPTAIAWVESPSRLLDLIKQRYRWTRGILQATAKHRASLWNPKAGVNFFILWYMLFEGIMWPFSTLIGNLFFIFVGLKFGLATLLAFWWIQLTLLDVVAAAYCVIIEEESPSLIPYAVAFRLFYINITDIAKVFATLEEWRGTAMTWGKLEREGKL